MLQYPTRKAVIILQLITFFTTSAYGLHDNTKKVGGSGYFVTYDQLLGQTESQFKYDYGDTKENYINTGEVNYEQSILDGDCLSSQFLKDDAKKFTQENAQDSSKELSNNGKNYKFNPSEENPANLVEKTNNKEPLVPFKSKDSLTGNMFKHNKGSSSAVSKFFMHNGVPEILNAEYYETAIKLSDGQYNRQQSSENDDSSKDGDSGEATANNYVDTQSGANFRIVKRLSNDMDNYISSTPGQNIAKYEDDVLTEIRNCFRITSCPPVQKICPGMMPKNHKVKRNNKKSEKRDLQDVKKVLSNFISTIFSSSKQNPEVIPYPGMERSLDVPFDPNLLHQPDITKIRSRSISPSEYLNINKTSKRKYLKKRACDQDVSNHSSIKEEDVIKYLIEDLIGIGKGTIKKAEKHKKNKLLNSFDICSIKNQDPNSIKNVLNQILGRMLI